MNTIEQIETKRGYHFTADTLRNGDPIPQIGEWISVSGPIIPCKSGLHMSEHPFDALQYAPGCMLHRVDVRGNLQPHGSPCDKWVGRERMIIATIDATDILRAFARFCALFVAHLWDCPDIVRTYLETGDESIRASAWASASASARDSASASAWASARAASAWAASAWASARDWDSADSADSAAKRERFQSIVDEAFEKELSK